MNATAFRIAHKRRKGKSLRIEITVQISPRPFLSKEGLQKLLTIVNKKEEKSQNFDRLFY